MIDKYPHTQCNGCKMCGEICPKKAISFNNDSFGFWKPVVDYSLCIKCKLCIKKCPQKNNEKAERHEISRVLSAWSKDEKIRLLSTSGGVFYHLAKRTLDNGGYVVGCVYDDNYRKAKHVSISSMEELEPLIQSKYLQSDTAGIYKIIQNLLKTRKRVLFVGTPCQNAALSMFLGKPDPNLLQVEFICRGITSPLAHEKYIEWLENKYHSKLKYFRSKDKRNGWNHFGTYALFESGEEYFSSRGNDPKVVSYHQDLTVRESCSDCKFKGLRRAADLTLADFWGVKEDARNPNLEMGTSAVLINSKKGEEAINECPDLAYYEVDIQDVINGNPALFNNIKLSKYMPRFWADFNRLPYDKLTEKYAKKTKRNRTFHRRLNRVRQLMLKPFRRKEKA